MRGKHFDLLENLCTAMVHGINTLDERIVLLDANIPTLQFYAGYVLKQIRLLNRKDSDLDECFFGDNIVDEPEDLRDDWPHAMPMPEEVRLTIH